MVMQDTVAAQDALPSAMAFAGGGNRCYWQGGFWTAAAPVIGLAPQRIVGASAGAWAACHALLGRSEEVVERVVEGCSQGVPNVIWRGLRPTFPVAGMYRELMSQVIDDAAFRRLRDGPEILVAIARPPRRLPLGLAIPMGIMTYQVEKAWREPVHPRGGRALGFRPGFLSVRQMKDREDLIAALMASASVPPFMPVGMIDGMPALDGGLVDNVPVEPLTECESRGGHTMVLLSRRYKAFPEIPNRLYVQPSQRIPIGQFDITRPEGIRKAYEMGLADGAAFAASWSSRSGRSAIDPST